MKKSSFLALAEEKDKEILRAKGVVRELEKNRKRFVEIYVRDVLKESGYNVGDKLTVDGQECFVGGGYEDHGDVFLKLHKPNTDGTMSKVWWKTPSSPKISVEE